MYKIDWEPVAGKPSKVYSYKSRLRALQHFDAVIKRAELVGKGYVARLYHRDVLVCCHHHDAPFGDANNWAGRLFEIPFPAAGRPASAEPRKGRSVSLTEAQWLKAMVLGGGNVSGGISAALKQACLADIDGGQNDF